MQYTMSKDWQDYIKQAEESWLLLDVAFLVALQLEQEPKVGIARDKLLEMKQELGARITKTAALYSRLQALNEYFFVELGFHGNHEDFFAEDNSFLDKVIDTRCGNPITMSILYIELAAAIGFEVKGINFPGHFLVQVQLDDHQQVLDPYNQAQPLDAEELEDLLAKHKIILHSDKELSGYLDVASKRDILIRLLRNLKNIYIEQQASEKALLTIELILSLDNTVIDEIRDRGMIYHYLDYTAGARRDLTAYLELQEDNDEHKIIKSLIESLDDQATVLH